jgi:hypothetical protein
MTRAFASPMSARFNWMKSPAIAGIVRSRACAASAAASWIGVEQLKPK